MKIKCEVSYLEIVAALGTGLAISNCLLQREKGLDVAFDVLASAGTYLISKAAFQVSRDVREWMVGSEPTSLSAVNASSVTSNKKSKLA